MVINTPKGLMQYIRMPYGIKPASSIFQNVMDNLLGNIPMVAVRADDILISGESDAKQLHHLERVMRKLSEVGITIRNEKCRFFMQEVENLGHIIDKFGIRVNPEKTEALKNARDPMNVKELQGSIGGVNYCSKFIPDMASICKPLYELLQDVKWTWGAKQKHAFNLFKIRLTNSPVLAVYSSALELTLDCDASHGVSAVLSQVSSNGNEKPIAFAIRFINKNEHV